MISRINPQVQTMLRGVKTTEAEINLMLSAVDD